MKAGRNARRPACSACGGALADGARYCIFCSQPTRDAPPATSIDRLLAQFDVAIERCNPRYREREQRAQELAGQPIDALRESKE